MCPAESREVLLTHNKTSAEVTNACRFKMLPLKNSSSA
jgi:hypothetical protein